MTELGIGTRADTDATRDSLPEPTRALHTVMRELKLDDWSAATIGEAASFPLFLERVRSGLCDGLSYLTSEPEARRSPSSALPNARAMLVVALAEARVRAESASATAMIYNAPELQSQSCDAARGNAVGAVSGYATCLDYHDLMRARLKGLARFLTARFPGASTRCAVDTAPILEKNWAVESGLGFIGLNSLVINPTLGSRFFLGEVLTSISFEELTGCATREEFDAARDALAREDGRTIWTREERMKLRERCLLCRTCQRACPTNAITPDGALDARRCLNYWTIENRDEIPDDIARALDGRLFGCDLCQRVCQHNARVEATAPRMLPLDAVERLDDATFRRLFKKTPVFRARVDGLQRVARALRERSEDEEAEKQPNQTNPHNQPIPNITDNFSTRNILQNKFF